MTTLSRLHTKGLLARERSGRAFAYRPVADEPGLAVRRIQQILDEGPDRETILTRFLGSLSRCDEQVLRRMVDDLDTRAARRPAPPPDR